jgi:cytosine/adenosine deaminase-related metal-dependent hydrolase
MILRARMVLPVARPPIGNGALVVRGNRFGAIGGWQEMRRVTSGKPIDLGEVVLCPGLVNAHCHLDYTNMAGQFQPPKLFIDWLKLITATKSGWNHSDYAASWTEGARMLVETGTTTVADIEAIPDLLPDVWKTTPLRLISFLEMIGITGRRSAAEILGEMMARAERLEPARGRVGLSPHAVYSTRAELLRLSGATARERGWRVATHVAESALELEMLAEAKGAMYDWLRRSGRDMSDCGLGSPVQHLERCALLGNNLLAIHVNYLARGDAALLARRAVHVVHCPRSHFYFGHAAFPLHRLRRAGVNICLGTDSLASVHKTRRQTVQLSMFDEMRQLAQTDPWLPPRTILRMATRNGARALGLSGRVGELSEKAYADLIAIPFTGKTSQVYEAVLAHQGPVSASLINGHWAMAPNTRKLAQDSP